MTDRTDSPTWEELDAICKGKSLMDLAAEIWRLRHRLAAVVMALHDADVLMNEGLDDAIQTYKPFMDKLRAWRSTLAAIKESK